MSIKSVLTQDRLKQLLAYDPSTGMFIWLVKRNGHNGGVRPGDTAGKINTKTGYVSIGVDGGEYYAHRLAFFYMTGIWPQYEIDHADGNRANNSFDNLREATRKQNAQNLQRRSDNSSGTPGVYWLNQTQRWIAEIMHQGTKVRLGSFMEKDAAVAARKLGEKKIFTHHRRA